MNESDRCDTFIYDRSEYLKNKIGTSTVTVTIGQRTWDIVDLTDYSDSSMGTRTLPNGAPGYHYWRNFWDYHSYRRGASR